MFDCITCRNVVVPIKRLIRKLDIATSLSETTGEVFTRSHRIGWYKGLKVVLKPKKSDPKEYTVELRGSPHIVRNNGLHNADDFHITQLLAVIDELVRELCIDPFLTKINSMELGVNVNIPFPVADVLRELICFKGVTFVSDQRNGGIYYEATFEQYTIKIYDKGTASNLSDNCLRFEIKIRKMAYLRNKGIQIDTIADLLNGENYQKMGRLLDAAFNEILFDERTVRDSVGKMTVKDRELYLWGCNPRNWENTDSKSESYNSDRKQLQRRETAFRKLLDKYRRGPDWRSALGSQINRKWTELTMLPTDWNIAKQEYLECWHAELCQPEIVPKSPILVPKSPPPVYGKMSQNHPLYSGEIDDNTLLTTTPPAEPDKRGESTTVANYALSLYPNAQCCEKTGIILDYGQPQNYYTDATKITVVKPEVKQKSKQHRRKRDYHSDEYYIAHNARNEKSNPPNNFMRQLKKSVAAVSVFSAEQVIKLTPQQRELLSYFDGKSIQIPIRL